MRLTGFLLLVGSSLLFVLTAGAATRPHYGGTLHVEMRAAPTSLDPADQSIWLETRNLFSLTFDTLVSLNEQGKPEPALATSWQAEPGNQRWRLFVRHGVTFQDGAPVTPDAVAASLRRTNPNWKVFSEGEAVIIERDLPAPNLPAELTLPRNSIVKREGGKVSGTGAFAVSQWDPGKKLLLVARDDYWDGRSFLDAIEIVMGKNFREQMISFDLGKAQVIEVAPEQAHRASTEGRHVESSAPVELISLVLAAIRSRRRTDDNVKRLLSVLIATCSIGSSCKAEESLPADCCRIGSRDTAFFFPRPLIWILRGRCAARFRIQLHGRWATTRPILRHAWLPRGSSSMPAMPGWECRLQARVVPMCGSFEFR
jgi:MarR-like DNA-binding transcriptional regulator SgrR of sgrS sRNA